MNITQQELNEFALHATRAAVQALTQDGPEVSISLASFFMGERMRALTKASGEAER